MRASSYRAGLQAEDMAAWMLRFKGYRILARRHRTPVGEIDLIARRGKTIVFVEVKARGDIEAALAAVRTRQEHRMIRAGEVYLAGLREPYAQVRFDLVAIAPGLRIRHVRGAFMR